MCTKYLPLTLNDYSPFQLSLRLMHMRHCHYFSAGWNTAYHNNCQYQGDNQVEFNRKLKEASCHLL